MLSCEFSSKITGNDVILLQADREAFNTFKAKLPSGGGTLPSGCQSSHPYENAEGDQRERELSFSFFYEEGGREIIEGEGREVEGQGGGEREEKAGEGIGYLTRQSNAEALTNVD